MALGVPPVMSNVPVAGLDGIVSVGLAVYSVIAVVCPIGLVVVVCTTPAFAGTTALPADGTPGRPGMVVVESPL